MWLLLALARLNFPVAVFRKRFAAPRCVLIFGISYSVRESGLGGLLVHLHGRENLVETVAEHLRARLRDGFSREVHEKPVEDLLAVLAPRHLPAPELDGRLDLVAVREELQDVLDLEVVIVVVDVRSELHFFYLCRLLFLLRVLLLLLLLIDELSEVHDPADGRVGGRRDLHEIETGLSRLLESVGHRNDAERLPLFSDQSDFLPPDLVVDSNRFLIDLSPP